jgi:hypothetical protein
MAERDRLSVGLWILIILLFILWMVYLLFRAGANVDIRA